MNVRPCGDAAVLLDCESLDEARRWYTAVRDRADAVLGARTVLLRGEPAALGALVATTVPAAIPADTAVRDVEIPVSYDGPDLEAVARHTSLTMREVVEAHTGTPWQVAFAGFSPGFAYLVGGDARLSVPRRVTPRTAVPSGSVALAGGFSAVYPRDSPGGWQLIGRTATAMWDLGRNPPALLVPGVRVRFVEMS